MSVNGSSTLLSHQVAWIKWLESDHRYYLMKKGRRVGATHFLAIYTVLWMALTFKAKQVLWGDVFSGNIKRYVKRYFYPLLKQLPKNKWSFNATDGLLKIYNTEIDFRSAGNVDAWDGEGYDFIIINEAGIVLRDKSLWQEHIIPMSWDNPNCKLLVWGVPKRKTYKGEEHMFFTLCEKARLGKKGFAPLMELTTYDNKRLSMSQLKEEEGNWDPYVIRQEMYGEFIEMSGMLWAYCFGEQHKVKCHYIKYRPVYVSVDFNVHPFTCTLAHRGTASSGKRIVKYFKEIYMEPHGLIPNKTYIENLAIRIKKEVGDSQINITGDASGNSRNVGMQPKATHWTELLEALGLNESHLTLPSVNPHLIESQEHINMLLSEDSDTIIEIDPDGCPELIIDLENCHTDEDGQIDKTTSKERSHLLDCFRYDLNVWNGLG